MTLLRRMSALAAVLLAACGGGGAQNRPVLTGSFPQEGTIVPAGIAAIRLDFDDEVTLFRVDALTLYANGVPQGVFIDQEPDETHSVRLSPLPGQFFAPGYYIIDVRGGLVLNTESHYAIDTQTVRFDVAGGAPLFVGSPTTNTVRELDGTTFAGLTSTPTPGGRDPVGIVAVGQGDTTRVFVQLASGGGNGRSLAHYVPGAGAMTEVLLSASPGSDLVATSPALALSPDGTEIYAAFRDTVSQRVRLHRVRTSDGVETGAIFLSPTAGATTAPTGLTTWFLGLELIVTCQEAAGGRAVHVAVPTFTEVDHDPVGPGVEGVPLGGPAGPSSLLGDFLAVAPTGAATAAMTFLYLPTDVVTPDTSTQVGVPTAVQGTFDSVFVVEGLGGPGAAPNLLTVRPLLDGTTDTPLAVSDLVGLAPQGATAVRALAAPPSVRILYVLLDANVLARFTWDAAGFVQDDLDAATAGVQAVGLAALVPGATCLGVLTSYPP